MTEENKATEAEDDNQGQDTDADETKADGAASRATDPSEIETLAMEEGWAPQDKWRGDPDEWVDAKTFIRNGRSMLKTTLRKQDEKLAELDGTIKEFAEHYKNMSQAAYDRALAELKAQQKAAVAEGDTEAFDAAEAQIGELEKNKPEEKKKGNGAAPESDPDFIRFQATNPWYGPDGDYEMTLAAEEAAKVIGRSYGGAEFYKKVAEVIRKKFPDRFENQARKGAPRVEAGATATRGTGKKSYEDLPSDAKAACDKFVKRGLLTKDQYVKDYFAQEQS